MASPDGGGGGATGTVIDVTPADLATCYLPEQIFEISDFEVGKHLGRGKFGSIYVARERFSKYSYRSGELFELLQKRGRFSEARAAWYLSQI
eukprot:g11381.t1